MLPQCTALDQHLPKQPYLPHSSISAQRLPSLRTRRTRRPTSSIHIAAASGSSSRATAHDGSPSRKESPSVINAIRQLEVTDSVLSSVCSVLWNTPGGGLALVSRETSPIPEKRLPCRPRQSGSARCHDRICRTSITDGTRSAPPKADVSAPFFRGSSTSYPVGHDVFNGRPLPGTGRRHQVAPHVLRHTPYLPPRREGHHVSSTA